MARRANLTKAERSERRRIAIGKYDTPMDAPLTEEQKAMAAQWSGLPAHIVHRRIARGRAPDGDRDERIHQGHLGLIRAAQVYDPIVGKFSGFAYVRILARVIRAEMDEAKAIGSATRFGDVDDVQGWLRSEPRGEQVDVEAVRNAVARLAPRLQSLVQKRVWEGKTLQEVGDDFGVGRERVRQLEEKAFGRLRELLASHDN